MFWLPSDVSFAHARATCGVDGGGGGRVAVAVRVRVSVRVDVALDEGDGLTVGVSVVTIVLSTTGGLVALTPRVGVFVLALG